MADQKVQLGAEFDATGVRAGVQQAKDAVRDLANTAATQGQAAGKGLDAIGEGGKRAADKVETATRSITAQIERATAAIKAGERGTASYFEALAQQRGANVDVLRPYIEQLRQAEAAQRAARGGLDGMGISARQTAAALRGVPAQFTDIVTALSSGQAPLTVFLQQGGQLKDMFGSAGAAAKALGGYVANLVTPYTIAATAAGGLAAAYYLGAKEAEVFSKALILSGNAAGVTAGQLQAMAAGVASLGSGTQGRASELLVQLAATGAVGAENMQKFTAAALAFERVGGPAAEEVVRSFVELGKSPLEAAKKLDESTNFLTASVLRQIAALTEQGRTAEAAKVAQLAYLDAIAQRTPQLQESITALGRAWIMAKTEAAAFLDQWLNIGRGNTLDGRRAELVRQKAELERAGQSGYIFGPSKKDIDAELGLIDKQLAAQQAKAEKAAEERKQKEAIIAADKLLEQLGVRRLSLAEREKAVTDQLVKAGTDKKLIEEAIAKVRAQYAEKVIKGESVVYKAETDAAKEYMQALQSLRKLTVDQQASADGLTKTQTALREIMASPVWASYSRQQREQLISAAGAAQAAEDQAQATKDLAKVQADGAASYRKWIDDLKRGAVAAEDQVARLTDEARATALAEERNISLAQAIQLVAIARLKERQVESLGNPDAVLLLEREIEARRKLLGLVGDKEARDASKKAADEASRQWTLTYDHISRGLTDAILTGGKSGADALKRMFKDLVLRPVLQAALDPLVRDLTDAVRRAVKDATGPDGGNSTAGQIVALLPYLDAVGSASQGKWGEAAGTAIGASIGGPAGAAIGKFLGSAVDDIFGGGKSAQLGYAGESITGGANINTRLMDFGRGDSNYSTDLQTIADSLGLQLRDVAKILGGSVSDGLKLFVGTDVDNSGKASGTLQYLRDGRRLGGVQTGGTDPLQVAATKIDANQLGDWFKTNASAAMIAGLQQADLPKRFADYFAGIVVPGLTPQQADQILATATAAQKLGTAFEDLGGAFSRLDELSVSVSGDLLGLFGGIDQFSSVVQQYYGDFYSQAERTAITTRQLTKSLGDLGLSLPANRDAYRALVDAQDLSTESGRKAYATLLQLSGAFASITQGAGDAADAAQQAAQAMAEAGRKALGDLAAQSTTLQIALLRAQGDSVAAAALERKAALDKLLLGLSAADAAAATAAYDLNTALQQQIEATNAASQAAQQAADAERQRQQAYEQTLAGLAATGVGLQIDLLNAQGNTTEAAKLKRQQELAELTKGLTAAEAARVTALYDANAALQQQVQAATLAQQAAQQAAAAAEQLRQSWQSVGDGIFTEVERIRSQMLGTSSASYASVQARFAVTTAQARAGDQEAAKLLPALGETLLTLAQAQARSLAELQSIRAATAASLEFTGLGLASRFGLTVPKLATGTDYVPQDMLAFLHQGEQVVPRAFNPAAGGGFSGADLVAEMRALRQDQRAQASALAQLQQRVARLLERWDAEGQPPQRSEA